MAAGDLRRNLVADPGDGSRQRIVAPVGVLSLLFVEPIYVAARSGLLECFEDRLEPGVDQSFDRRRGGIPLIRKAIAARPNAASVRVGFIVVSPLGRSRIA